MAIGVKVWIDAQLSPALAQWLTGKFGVEAAHVSELNLVNASDPAIFGLARNAGAIILTKDRDLCNWFIVAELLRKSSGSPAAIRPTKR